MLYAIPFLATCGAVMNDLLAALRAEFIGRTQRASALRAKFSHVFYFTVVVVSLEVPAGACVVGFTNGVPGLELSFVQTAGPPVSGAAHLRPVFLSNVPAVLQESPALTGATGFFEVVVFLFVLGFALEFGFEQAHDFAHVFSGGGAGFLDGGGDGGGDFGFGHLCWYPAQVFNL